MARLKIDNYIISTPIIEILERLRLVLTNGKLKDIKLMGNTEVRVTCPVHSDGHEATPACDIYIGEDTDRVKYGMYNCLVCGAKGGFVRFVAECFDSTDIFAKKWLIENFGEKAFDTVQIAEPITLNKKTFVRKKFDGSVLNTYQSYCPYLAKRKISKATCERFNIKYDPKYRHVVFPCYDTRGNLVMMPWRSIDVKTFYLDKAVEKPVYCLNEIVKNNIRKAIITEGPFDCLTGWEYGIPTIATLGTPSDYQIDQINKSCLEVIYTMFDNDASGQKFTRDVTKKLARRILIINIKIPDGRKDINDLSREEFENLFKKYNNF